MDRRYKYYKAYSEWREDMEYLYYTDYTETLRYDEEGERELIGVVERNGSIGMEGSKRLTEEPPEYEE
jgi:hypothetical protein